MIAILCDSHGRTMLGTDGVIYIDGRYGQEKRMKTVREYRERFKKNFVHKHKYWTHVYFCKSVIDHVRQLHVI